MALAAKSEAVKRGGEAAVGWRGGEEQSQCREKPVSEEQSQCREKPLSEEQSQCESNETLSRLRGTIYALGAAEEPLPANDGLAGVSHRIRASRDAPLCLQTRLRVGKHRWPGCRPNHVRPIPRPYQRVSP